MIPLKVKRLEESAILPSKNNSTDAGFDLYTTEEYYLKSGEAKLFSTGIACKLPEGFCALLWDRSGLGSKGIHRLAGVIDCSYRGEWKVCLINLSGMTYHIMQGDRICQAIIQTVEFCEVEEVSELDDSSRGEQGFGSSGR